jgi:CRISPR system Cascade subunit CasA
LGALLIDAPGDSTTKQNKDFFVKLNQFFEMSLPIAGLALFTLQLNAPEGGAGNVTGLRGGGPLTTLILPEAQKERPITLWEILWANVLSEEEFGEKKFEMKDAERIFPWLKSAKSSEKNQVVTPNESHPLLMFWATPRRIRLNISVKENSRCSVTGKSERCISSFYNRGSVKYVGWRHVLSPHYTKGKDTLPMHPNVGGMGYKNWTGWIFGGNVAKNVITQSKNISVAQDELKTKYSLLKGSIWAFGYDMDKKKARGWQEAIMPFLTFQKSSFQAQNKENLLVELKNAIAAAEFASSMLKNQIKLAWKLKSGSPEQAEREFWQSTQESFVRFLMAMHEIYDVQEKVLYSETFPHSGVLHHKEKWIKILSNAVLALYDKYVSGGDVEFQDIEGITMARKGLHSKKFKSDMRKKMSLPEVKNESN